LGIRGTLEKNFTKRFKGKLSKSSNLKRGLKLGPKIRNFSLKSPDMESFSLAEEVGKIRPFLWERKDLGEPLGKGPIPNNLRKAQN